MRLRTTFLAVSVMCAGVVLVPDRFDSIASANQLADVTVLVYSHGDNDLDGSLVGPGDLNEMARRAGEVNFVVYHDRAAGREELDAPHLDLPVGYTGGYVFRVGPDGRAVETVNLDEPYSMAPQTLSWFIYHGLTKYPARTTILVMDDHGGGPAAYFGSPELDTPSNDPNAAFGPMSVRQVTDALRAGISAAANEGWRGGRNGMRLDAIVHATCVNGSYEVIRSLAPHARYSWGSEEVTVGSNSKGAWDVNYAAPLPDSNSSDFALDYLKSLVGDGPSLYRQMGTNPSYENFNNISTAIFDLDQMSTVDTAMRGFVEQVKKSNGYRHLVEARSKAIGFGDRTGTTNIDLYDLGDILANISPSAPAPMLSARTALFRSIENARRYLVTGGRYEGASGLSIYFPSARNGMSVSYEQLPDPTGWTRLIRDSRITGESSIGKLTLTTKKTSTAWKATLAAQRKIPSSADGFFAIGDDGGTRGIRVLSRIQATLGAGGPTKTQASGTFSRFTFGDSPVSLRFNKDLTSASFGAILVRASSGEQSTVTATVKATYKGGSWTFGAPEFVQQVGGSLATVIPLASDVIAPLTEYLQTSPLPKNPNAFTLGISTIPQLAVAPSSRLSASVVPASTPLRLVANLWDDSFETRGDLAIEQTEVVR